MIGTSAVTHGMQMSEAMVTTGTDRGRHYLALDGWRGVCAVLVAVMHFGTNGHISEWLVVRNAHLFVDFFFVLSGFVLMHAYRDRLTSIGSAGTMIWRRIGRLWPLHVAVLIGFVVLELAVPVVSLLGGMATTSEGPFDAAGTALLSAIPSHLLLLNGMGLHDRLTWNFPSWSISVEFWTYVIFAAVMLNGRRTVLLAFGLAALGALAVWQFSQHYMATEHDFGFFRCLYGFFVGVMVYRLSQMQVARLAMPNLVEFAAVAGLLCFVAIAGGTAWEFAVPIVVAAIVWVFAREEGFISRGLATRPLQLIGKWSFSIYMIHSLIIAMVHRAVTVIQQNAGITLYVDTADGGVSQRVLDFGNPYLMDGLVVVYAAVIIALSAVTWRLIERPSQEAWNARLPSIGAWLRSIGRLRPSVMPR